MTIVVPQGEVIGVVVSRPDFGAIDPSTGQKVSVIKTGSDPHNPLPQYEVPKRTIPKESQAQDAD